MRRFGIFSPTLGERHDFPTVLLERSYLPESENIQIRYGELHRAKMRSEFLKEDVWDIAKTYSADDRVRYNSKSWKSLQDNNTGHEPAEDGWWTEISVPSSTHPILEYHWYDRPTGEGYEFAFTDDNIYLWDTTLNAWEPWLAGGVSLAGTAEQWFAVTFEDKVFATNGVDKVLIGDNSNKFDWLGSASGIEYATGKYLTKANFAIVFEGYLMLGYTTEDSIVYRQRLRWCKLHDYTDWITSDTSDAGAVDVGGPDDLTGGGLYKDFHILFKGRSIYRQWLVPNELIFSIGAISREIGCVAPKSIINGQNGELYFLASDKTIREIQMGEISQAVDPILKLIPDELIHKVCATRIDEYGELWWAIPYGAQADGNNKILTLKNGQRWTTRAVRDQDDSIQKFITAFGKYEQQENVTIDGMDHYFDTIDDIDWTFDGVEGTKGFPLDIAADYEGNTYLVHDATTDKGDSYTGRLDLTTDLGEKGMLDRHKRVYVMRAYLRGEAAGNVTFYARRDGETTWQQVGTVTLVTNDEFVVLALPCDLRAKHYEVRCAGTNPFRFLGVLFDFQVDGSD